MLLALLWCKTPWNPHKCPPTQLCSLQLQTTVHGPSRPPPLPRLFSDGQYRVRSGLFSARKTRTDKADMAPEASEASIPLSVLGKASSIRLRYDRREIDMEWVGVRVVRASHPAQDACCK